MDRERIFYGVGRLELHFPQSHSLKDKRAILNSLKARLAERLRVAVIDAGSQDLWQRGTLGVCLMAREESQVRASFQTVRRLVEEDYRVVLLDFRTRVGGFDDADEGEEEVYEE